MADMIKAQSLLAAALGVSEEDVGAETAIGVTTEWDSIAHMRLILALEEQIGCELDMETIVDISNLADVENLLAQNNQENKKSPG